MEGSDLRSRALDALQAQSALGPLRLVVQQELTRGVDRASVLDVLDSLRPELDDAQEDVVLEVMDAMTGWCGPSQRLCMTQPRLELDRQAAIEIARRLNSAVVSLDRIGSTFSDRPDEMATALSAYAKRFDLWSTLAAARRLLTEALEAGLTEDEVRKLEDELNNAAFWTVS